MADIEKVGILGTQTAADRSPCLEFDALIQTLETLH